MNPLVSPQWVAEHLLSGTLTLVDATLPPVGIVPAVDTWTHYLEMHLPGAVFFDIEALSDQETTLPHMLPRADRFAREMSALGIGSSATIVVYEQGNVFSAPRAWWMLRSFGARDVRILDGGLSAWIDAGLPVEKGPVTRSEAEFHASFDEAAVARLGEVERMLQTGGQIVDARSVGRFAGTSPEPRPGLPSGHMPGAVSLPYTELTQRGRMRSVETIRAAFMDRGIDLSAPVVTTCGSGVTAAVLALALELSSASRVEVYDGSWAEYAGRPDAAIEPAPKKTAGDRPD